MVSAIMTDNESDNMAVWVAALVSTARTRHGIVRLPVSRLHAGIEHLVKTGTATDLTTKDGKLQWFGRALADAQDLGLEIEGAEGEFVSVTIEQAKKILKWINSRNGLEYANRMAERADALADFLNRPS